MEERWLPVVGFEGFYEVSNQGRVRSLPRVVPHPTSGKLTIKERMVKASLGAQMKYPMVNLWRDNKGHSKYVHALVLESFVGPRPTGQDACHKDGTKGNNCLSNLRWDTRKGNVADAYSHGTALYGDRAPWSKLNLDQVLQIRGDKRSGRVIAEQYGVCRQTIDDIRRGKNWSRAVIEAGAA